MSTIKKGKITRAPFNSLLLAIRGQLTGVFCPTRTWGGGGLDITLLIITYMLCVICNKFSIGLLDYIHTHFCSQ